MPPGDAAALEDAVVSLLGDEERRARLGAAARQVALDRYSWDAIGQRLVEIYELVLARAGRSTAVT